MTWLLGLAVLTLAWADGDPVPYRWVEPPPHLRSTNVAPSGVRAAGASGSVATSDGQAIVTLPEGVTGDVEIEPLDPAGLGDLAVPELEPDGNAYRVEVPTLDQPGSITLTAPVPPRALLFSADGERWQPVEDTRIVGTAGFGGPLTRSGFYLLASRESAPVQGVEEDRRPVLAIVAAVALGLAGGIALLWPTLLRSRGGGRE